MTYARLGLIHAAGPAVLAVAYQAGQARWAGVDLSQELFARHVATLGVPNADLAVHGADLYLACACAFGDTMAIRHFEGRVFSQVHRHIARGSSHATEDLLQLLRLWLLAGPKPRIARYSARGSLLGWLKVASARRLARIASRAPIEPFHLGERAMAELLSDGGEAARSHMSRMVAPTFEAALEATFLALTPEARTLLRMHYVQDVSLAAIADAFGVHRATVARWLSVARTTVRVQVRERLAASRAPTSSEFHSLTAAVISNLHVNVRELLETPGPSEAGSLGAQ
jgi:RNA polymerase sigma-70 factor (ECF subfamily)